MTGVFSPGDIIDYPYRWAQEAALDRSIDGAKDRPCCLVISTVDQQGARVLFLLAISSKPPRAGQSAMPIPEIERRRSGLDKYPEAWIYIGEANRDADLGVSWYLEPKTPLGTFSKALVCTP